jgi:hypothetical protein
MTTLAALIAGGMIAAGCVSNQPKTTEAAPPPDSGTTAAPAAAAAPQPAPAPAPVAAKPICKPTPATKTSKKQTKTTKSKEAAAKPVQEDCTDPIAAGDNAPATVTPVPAPAPVTVVGGASAGGYYDLSKNKPVTDSTKVEAGQGTKVKGINDWEGEVSGVPFAGAKFTKLKIGMPYAEAIDLVGSPTDEGAYVTGKAFIPFYFGSDRGRWEAAYKGQGRLIFSLQSGFGTGRYLTWVIYNQNERGYR